MRLIWLSKANSITLMVAGMPNASIAFSVLAAKRLRPFKSFSGSNLDENETLVEGTDR